jgi:hypothetical protein
VPGSPTARRRSTTKPEWLLRGAVDRVVAQDIADFTAAMTVATEADNDQAETLLSQLALQAMRTAVQAPSHARGGMHIDREQIFRSVAAERRSIADLGFVPRGRLRGIALHRTDIGSSWALEPRSTAPPRS